MSLRYNKKGSILDTVGIMIALLVLVVSFFLGNLMFNEFTASDILNEHNETTRILEEGTWFYNNMADNLILLAYIGISIGAIISAVLSKAHPIYMYLSVIISLFMMIIAVVISNWYEEFATNDVINSIVVNYPHTNFVMEHMPLMTLAVIFLVAISLYMARGRNAQIQL